MKKMKEGMSVKEIEDFAKRHRFEVFFCLSFIFACLFSFVFFGPGWALVFGAAGGILGVIIPGKVDMITRKVFGFIFKQEQLTQIVLGVVMLVIAIFLPPLIFLKLGMHGGKNMHQMAMEIASQYQK